MGKSNIGALDVVTEKIDKIVDEYKMLPKQVAVCTSRALTRTAAFVSSRLATDVSQKKSIKLKAVRNLITLSRATLSENYRTLQVDTTGILVRDLGNLKQTDHGVSAGGKVYNKHSFVASLKGGKSGVYRRLTKKRFPVKSVRIPIYQDIMESLADIFGIEAVQFFEKRFLHELQFMVSKGRVS